MVIRVVVVVVILFNLYCLIYAYILTNPQGGNIGALIIGRYKLA